MSELRRIPLSTGITLNVALTGDPEAIPTLVIWGMRDKALLPVQLARLDRLVEDLTIVRLPDAGHFAPWEAPAAVARAHQSFLANES